MVQDIFNKVNNLTVVKMEKRRKSIHQPKDSKNYICLVCFLVVCSQKTTKVRTKIPKIFFLKNARDLKQISFLQYLFVLVFKISE